MPSEGIPATVEDRVSYLGIYSLFDRIAELENKQKASSHSLAALENDFSFEKDRYTSTKDDL